jgi:two-component system response regulator CitB
VFLQIGPAKKRNFGELVSKIIIVEDNPDIAILYQRALIQHQTSVFRDIPAAMEHLKHTRPDLAILDFYLPSGSGMSLLQYMRSNVELESIPVLGISADDSLKDTAESYGISAFLAKPINVGEMIKVTQQLLKKSA